MMLASLCLAIYLVRYSLVSFCVPFLLQQGFLYAVVGSVVFYAVFLGFHNFDFFESSYLKMVLADSSHHLSAWCCLLVLFLISLSKARLRILNSVPVERHYKCYHTSTAGS